MNGHYVYMGLTNNNTLLLDQSGLGYLSSIYKTLYTQYIYSELAIAVRLTKQVVVFVVF